MKEFQELAVRHMTRKEFLQFGLLAIAGLFGFKNFITYLLEHQKQKASTVNATSQSKSRGFGSSKFGA